MLAPSADPAFARDYIDLIEDRTPAPGGLADLFTSLGVRLIFGRGEEVFGQGEPADFVYRVLTGAVRTFRMMSDGRRQISDFHLAGDVFGMESGEVHRLGAEAIGPTTVMMMRRKTLTDLAANDRVMAARVWALMAQTLQRTQDHMLRLGCQNACERLCAFLLDLADRSPPGPALELDLPMPRQDIADYLGVTIETVSRTLTQLQTAGWISLPATRRIVLGNRAALARTAG